MIAISWNISSSVKPFSSSSLMLMNTSETATLRLEDLANAVVTSSSLRFNSAAMNGLFTFEFV